MIRLLQRTPPATRPRVGLALGGGGSKGFAHLGVMRVLREEGIPIDVIAGTSIGAIIGALHCAGFGLDHILEGMRGADRRVRRWRLSRLAVWSDEGLRDLLEASGAELRFEDLWLPFAAVATDLTSGTCAVLDQGPLWPAVQASCAMPGIFPPANIGGHLMIDGGVACPVPAQAARRLGADVVIAVDLGEHDSPSEPPPWPAKGKTPGPMALWSRVREIQRWQIDRYSAEAADVVIKPGIRQWRWRDFSSNGDVYMAAGEEAARKALAQIAALVAGPAARQTVAV